jgi:hypothetical protein
MCKRKVCQLMCLAEQWTDFKLFSPAILTLIAAASERGELDQFGSLLNVYRPRCYVCLLHDGQLSLLCGVC